MRNVAMAKPSDAIGEHPQDKGAVALAVERLESVLGELHNEMNHFESRIEPVLRPEDVFEGEPKGLASGGGAPLANSLNNLTDSLAYRLDQLRNWQRRLEV